VLINKEDYTGRSDIELTAGNYKIEVAKQNYLSVAELAVLEVGQTTQKSVTPVARTGDLQVSVQPPDAGVQLIRDGKVVQEWQGLKIVKGLIIGMYTLKATATGYIPLSKDLVVEEGKTVPIDCAVTKESGPEIPPSRDTVPTNGTLNTIVGGIAFVIVSVVVGFIALKVLGHMISRGSKAVYKPISNSTTKASEGIGGNRGNGEGNRACFGGFRSACCSIFGHADRKRWREGTDQDYVCKHGWNRYSGGEERNSGTTRQRKRWTIKDPRGEVRVHIHADRCR
jgi:hypothetical protein